MTQRKRRPINAGGRKVTAAAVEAFRAGDAETLRRELTLRPWECNPLDVADGEPCPYPAKSAGGMWWPECLALRAALQQAARKAG